MTYWAQIVGRLHSSTSVDMYSIPGSVDLLDRQGGGSIVPQSAKPPCPWVHSYFPMVIYNQTYYRQPRERWVGEEVRGLLDV